MLVRGQAGPDEGRVSKVDNSALCDWCRQPVTVEQAVVVLCRYSNKAFIVIHTRPTDDCWDELVEGFFKQTGERWSK